jgi:hypothetical protein
MNNNTNTNSKNNNENTTNRAEIENDELTMEELEAVSGGTGKNIYGLKTAKKRIEK